MRISSNKISRKLVDLFANSQVTQNQWKFDITEDILDEHIGIIATAKNFADGINYQIDRHGIEIPADLIVASREYNEHIVHGKKLIKDVI